MNLAADQDLLLYSALPNDSDCQNEYPLPQSIQEEGGFFQNSSLSHSLPSASQPGILQDSWHPTSAQADHAFDGWFERDWVLFPDTPDPVEQPDDITENSIVLSSYGSLEEAQFRVDRHVQRTLEQRHLVAQSGKNKRPANAFILYRIAFQCVAEEFYSTKCQQFVSRICGKSWQLESDDVKAWFQEQATIQKANYTQAFEHA
ncbi:hypothetical protein FOMG_18465 [Fusarium oxysporum f. sp. melonis 26406]|uniref:HMG box domain-containing protein n=1 Tax=Fusarium oxysporum f. sp. melonis 26406 TaxID=1089452 RepID=W9Z991_FUSOX|nr:hypothetical protein FOMG_18465 [Fusarium oxysporum f. sp. melonis 26406]